MRIIVHIGPDGAAAGRLQQVLDAKRDQLLGKGVLYARSPGAKNHTRLFMAVTDPENIDSLRFNRGYIAPEKQRELHDDVAGALAEEVSRANPHTLILSAHQLGTSLVTRSELDRLRALLAPLSVDIRIVAHLDDPARLAVSRYAAQLLEGRRAALDAELSCCAAPSFWEAALAARPACDPQAGQFAEVQGAAFWLDFKRLQREWEAVFGPGAVAFRSTDPGLLASVNATEEIRAAFDIAETIGKAAPWTRPVPPSAAWLTRCRLFNDAVLRLLALKQVILPRPLWRKFQSEIKVPGPAIEPGALAPLSARFETDIEALCIEHDGLDAALMAPDAPQAPWQEADPTRGFRATQYLMAFRWRINQATKEELAARAADLARLAENATQAAEPEATSPPQMAMANTAPSANPTPGSNSGPNSATSPSPASAALRASAQATPPPPSGDIDALLTPTARALMPDAAKRNFLKLQASSFAPHNRLGRVNEAVPGPDFAPAPRRQLTEGTSGRVIVGCMKNEGPYILEWVAYHRAVGFDTFLIYTNGCEDGTTEILDRLQVLGLLQHRNNDNWSGNSPQQVALDRALEEPVVRNAEWITHIDVDEFVNVRTGNGTLDALFAAVPDATNIAMTWRLFGHNGVAELADRPVIGQFDTCAPKYCPKPHTVWGFKTMFANIGAYGKISCHRPNKLAEGFERRVKWVNGSGRDMTKEARMNGWRSSKKSIGYDLVQLNHYALRSAESYLIKRQRGRALHVDRNIGINYWIRMDWCDHRDVTIQRNLSRLRAELNRLLADPVLKDWHGRAFDWHRAKARALRQTPEFEDLYEQALTLKLTETERVAYALALDLEN
ncbi:glycosyltransferase family 2 protein [Sagittula salina]|uniref:Glycosyltransferase family 2 protein n=1 Tax=Sagittula salina TaxID=2820268 RepID=A0A940RYJ4_9RHOB|nr:glycosyltransferase family 2 protein [Sagittula salina]MBP0480933.1 glycosyltransferase family 2 protein [Sagittula salina]